MGASGPPGSPPGSASASRSRKPIVLILVAVVVVAVLAGAAVYVLLSRPPAQPPAEPTLASVDVTADKSAIDPRENAVVTARAIDTDGVDQTANATFTWTANPSGRVVLSGLGAQRTAEGRQAGLVSIQASGTWKNVTQQGAVSITVNLLMFQVTLSDSSPTTAAPVTVGVRVLRGTATATSYLGTVRFSSSDALATLPPDTAFTSNDLGWKNFSNVVFRTAGAQSVTVQDTDAALAITGSGSLNVQRPPGFPTAAFTLTRDLMRVDLDASTSTDPDNDITTYEWDYENDGTFDSTGAVRTHTYTTAGPKVVRLRVTDFVGHQDNATQGTSVATSTIDYEYWDFFNVPYRDYWDLRISFGYFELPMNAECFTQTGIDEGLCSPVDPAVPDTLTYPYTHWYSPVPPGRPNFNPIIYAPFRLQAVGNDVSGYNRSEPVFLPVFNYGESASGQVNFTWTYQYMNNTRGDELGVICATNWVFGNDGYISENHISLTMDLQQSKRMFGVVASNAAEASTWWSTNTNSACGTQGVVETQLENWFVLLGGTQFTMGKYNIINGYEWYYQPFATNINWTVSPTGVTTLDIIHIGYGTEALLGRWFYWGNVSYLSSHLDSTKAQGWWGMEQSWFEDFNFSGALGGSTVDFRLETAVEYNFLHTCGPGPNLAFDRIDDEARWTFGPFLLDYVDDFYPQHPVTELDRYGGPDGDAGTNDDLAYAPCTPGAPVSTYGRPVAYDLTPETWDPKDGETWRFRFPTGNAPFYDPNLTPPGADPTLGAYVNFTAPFEFVGTKPTNFGSYDPATKIWTVLGRATTGGPVGSPGLDGVVGTGDDAYPDSPWPLITFTNGTPVPAPPLAGLAAADIADAGAGSSPRDSAPAPSPSAGSKMDSIATSEGRPSAAGRSSLERYWTTRAPSRWMALLVPRPTGLSAG